jgi:hypothetical protein
LQPIVRACTGRWGRKQGFGANGAIRLRDCWPISCQFTRINVSNPGTCKFDKFVSSGDGSLTWNHLELLHQHDPTSARDDKRLGRRNSRCGIRHGPAFHPAVSPAFLLTLVPFRQSNDENGLLRRTSREAVNPHRDVGQRSRHLHRRLDLASFPPSQPSPKRAKQSVTVEDTSEGGAACTGPEPFRPMWTAACAISIIVVQTGWESMIWASRPELLAPTTFALPACP